MFYVTPQVPNADGYQYGIYPPDAGVSSTPYVVTPSGRVLSLPANFNFGIHSIVSVTETQAVLHNDRTGLNTTFIFNGPKIVRQITPKALAGLSLSPPYPTSMSAADAASLTDFQKFALGLPPGMSGAGVPAAGWIPVSLINWTDVLVMGIDQNNNAYMRIGNTYYYDGGKLNNDLHPSLTNLGPEDALYWCSRVFNSSGSLSYAPPGTMPSPWGVSYSTIADLIGIVRNNPNPYFKSIPFTVYAPPVLPAPSQSAPPPAPAPPAIPAGFSIFAANMGVPRVYPVYGSVPVHDPATNTWSFAGATQFTTLTSFSGIGPYQNGIGLDPLKLAAGLYAYRETDLGAFNQPNNRTYEFWQLDFFDLATQKPFGTFFETVEGGGGGLLIGDPLALASRIVVDVSTMGTAEAARAAAQAAGVSQQNITLATEAGAALAVTIATAGGIIAATSAPVAGAAATGAATAGQAGVVTGAAVTTAPELVTAGEAGVVTASGATAADVGLTTGGASLLSTVGQTTVGKLVTSEITRVGATLLNTAILNPIMKFLRPAPSQPTAPQVPGGAAQPTGGINWKMILGVGAALYVFAKKKL